VISGSAHIHNREQADNYIRDKMPKESYFQKCIKKWINNNVPEAFVWKEAAGPYTRSGIPDISCVFNGRYYGFEVKRPFIGVLSKIQEETIRQLREAGAVVEVVSFEKEVAAVLLPEQMKRSGKVWMTRSF
jgi:hypothetical protein